jgi:hypothetical protein
MSATNVIKGVIDSARTKTVKTRNGDKPVYLYTVDGVEFSTAFNQDYAAGEMVSVGVQFKYNEWQKVAGSDGAGLPAATNSTPAASGGGGRKSGGSKFPVDPLDGQISIIRQSSMKVAVEAVDSMIRTGVITAPADQDAYLKVLISVALTITDFGSGQDIMQLKAAQAANLTAAAA